MKPNLLRNTRLVFALLASSSAFAATQALADTPSLQWGSDTRAMTQPDCLNRAKFAIGERQLNVCGGDGSDVAGCGNNVSVLVTCVQMGARTFISVIGASPDGGLAAQTRNDVRSIVMGPDN